MYAAILLIDEVHVCSAWSLCDSPECFLNGGFLIVIGQHNGTAGSLDSQCIHSSASSA